MIKIINELFTKVKLKNKLADKRISCVSIVENISEKYKNIEIIQANNYTSDTYCKKIDSYSIKDSISKYKTNINNQQCFCPDWLELRNHYEIDDPRRFCKHLINLLNIDNLSNTLLFYKKNFKFYRENEKGYKLNFYKVIDIPNSNYKLQLNYNHDWMDFLSNDGLRYGVLFDRYNQIYWTKDKPHNYKIIELFLIELLFGNLYKLSNDEKNQIQSKLTTQVIEFFEKEKTDKYIIYGMDWDGEKYLEKGFQDYGEELHWNNITITNEIIFVNLNDRNFTIQRDIEKNYSIHNKEKEKKLQKIIEDQKLTEKYEQKEQEYLKNKKIKNTIKNNIMFEKGYIPTKENNDYLYGNIDKFLELKESIHKKYEKINKLSKRISITTQKINKSLLQMNMIKKNNDYNMGDYILINDGLNYGMNFERNSKYSHISIPTWYLIYYIDEINLELKERKERKNIKFTDIYYKIDKYDELLLLIKGELAKEKESTIDKIYINRTELRNEWLKDKYCEKCESKNLHKKGIRRISNKDYQRFQCMDCRSMFQEEIN